MAGDSQIIVFWFYWLFCFFFFVCFGFSVFFGSFFVFCFFWLFWFFCFFWFFWFCLLFSVLRLGLRGWCCQRRFERVKHGKCALPGTPVLKKYDLLPPVCGAGLSKMVRSSICCHQFVLECQICEKVRFVATSLRCSMVKDEKKYVLLPPVCAERW